MVFGQCIYTHHRPVTLTDCIINASSAWPTENLGLGADRSLGLGADRSLGLGADRRLGLSADRRLGLGADRRLGLGADRRLGLSADRRLGCLMLTATYHARSLVLYLYSALSCSIIVWRNSNTEMKLPVAYFFLYFYINFISFKHYNCDN